MVSYFKSKLQERLITLILYDPQKHFWFISIHDSKAQTFMAHPILKLIYQ